MNHRERQLAILAHQPPDRIPFVPRLELWYQAHVLAKSLPTRFAGMSLRQVEAAIGVATTGRFGRIFEKTLEPPVTKEVTNEAGKRITHWHTPVGSVRQVEGYSDNLTRDGLPGRVEEYPIKRAEDYKVWEYVIQHTHWQPRYDEFRQYDAEIGHDGLPIVEAGDVPFHSLILDTIGYDDAFYHLLDYQEEFEHLLAVMHEVERYRLWPVIAASPAKLILHGIHLSSQFTPPPLYREYILPYYREFVPLMHAVGKSVTMHADNDTSLIMSELEESGFDMLECFITAPMVPLTMQRAREVWGNRMILFGGLPSVLFSPHIPEADFRAYVVDLLATVAPGDAFIMGVADNVMPDSLIERVEWVEDYLEAHGTYPLSS
ncbi:MAG: hypothetical protein GXY52_10745 [Chloroflexi bacterium]|nr:hypothetical protein [Chloroflexota bacterium]